MHRGRLHLRSRILFFVTHREWNGLLDREPMDSVQSSGAATIFLKLRFRFTQRHNAGHCPQDMKPTITDSAVQFFPGVLFVIAAALSPLIMATAVFWTPRSGICRLAVKTVTARAHHTSWRCERLDPARMAPVALS